MFGSHDSSPQNKSSKIAKSQKHPRRMHALVTSMILVVLVLCLLVPLGCAKDERFVSNNDNRSDTVIQNTISVKLVVSSENADGSVALDTTMDMIDGVSAYSVLEASDLSVNASSGEYGMYVEAIGGLSAGAFGETSGWTYTINGEQMDVACDAYLVKDGDSVEWTYVTTWE